MLLIEIKFMFLLIDLINCISCKYRTNTTKWTNSHIYHKCFLWQSNYYHHETCRVHTLGIYVWFFFKFRIPVVGGVVDYCWFFCSFCCGLELDADGEIVGFDYKFVYSFKLSRPLMLRQILVHFFRNKYTTFFNFHSTFKISFKWLVTVTTWYVVVE